MARRASCNPDVKSRDSGAAQGVLGMRRRYAVSDEFPGLRRRFKAALAPRGRTLR
jgi:hypothetical protein